MKLSKALILLLYHLLYSLRTIYTASFASEIVNVTISCSFGEYFDSAIGCSTCTDCGQFNKVAVQECSTFSDRICGACLEGFQPIELDFCSPSASVDLVTPVTPKIVFPMVPVGSTLFAFLTVASLVGFAVLRYTRWRPKCKTSHEEDGLRDCPPSVILLSKEVQDEINSNSVEQNDSASFDQPNDSPIDSYAANLYDPQDLVHKDNARQNNHICEEKH